MFKKLVFFLILSFALLGCGGSKGGDVGSTNTEDSVVATIELKADKTIIDADGIDTITLSVIVKDKDNNIIDGANISYYEGSTKLTGNTFKTTTAGTYNITAKAGSVTSNIISVTANENVAQLQSITVKSYPTKKNYYVGDTVLDMSALVIEGKYSNNFVKTESVSLSNITGFDTSSVGVKTLTVTINEKTATFNITVLDEFIKSNFTLKKKVDFLELNEYSADFEVYDSSVSKIIFSGTDLISISEINIANKKAVCNSIKIGQTVNEVTLTAVDVNGKQIGNIKKVLFNN